MSYRKLKNGDAIQCQDDLAEKRVIRWKAAEKPKDTVSVGIKCICYVGYCPECGGFQDDLAENCRYCGIPLDWTRWKELNE